MAERKLFNARNELFGLMLFCESRELTTKMMTTIRSEDWFHTSWARKTYKRIRELYKTMDISEGVIPFTSLCADDMLPEDVRTRLESGRKKFKGEKIDVNAVISSLDRFRKFRRLNELSEHINSVLADENENDPDKLIKHIEIECSEARFSHSSVQDNIFSVGEEFSMTPVLEKLLSDEVQTVIPTGIKEFDDRNGGISPGSLFLIAGNTGGGKTLTAMNVSENMSLYAKTCYVPLEMTASEMVARQFAKHGRVPINRIVSKKWTEDEKDACLEGYKSFHRKVKAQGSTYSIFKPDQDMDIEEVLMSLLPYDYEVVCIDYISLLKGVDGDDAWRKLNEACRLAKIHASTYNKVVIILAQLKDEGSLSYSKGMLDHFNNAWFFLANQETKETGYVHVTQPKARNSDPSPFDLEIEYEFMSIGESSSSGVTVADPKRKKKRKKAEAETEEKPEREVKPLSSRRKAKPEHDETEERPPKRKRKVDKDEDTDYTERQRRNDEEEDEGGKEGIRRLKKSSRSQRGKPAVRRRLNR